MVQTPPFDNCFPINMAGPFQQTMFLGCSIVSFSAGVGWSSQASELTVQLVQDPCPNPAGKIYYDNLLNQQTWTAADPGFVGDVANWNNATPPDIIGCAAYFRVGTFEYCGLIQSWQRTDSTSSHPTYTVTLQDPRYILETVKLIIKDYAGQITLPNVFNVYGFMESLGVACPQTYLNDTGQDPQVKKYSTSQGYQDDGAIIGSPAGGFGGADMNPNGMPYLNVIQGFNVLANAIPQNLSQFSLYGRVVYKAPITTMDARTCGLIMPETALAAYYFVDLSDLPTAPTYYRINAGTTIDVLTLISTICTDAGYEFYIELLPVISGGNIYKFIKVRTVRRFAQPQLGAIEAYIGTGNGLISTNYGREARLENTNSMYIGGPKQSLYQLEGEKAQADTTQNLIIPYFGVDQWTGNTIIPYRVAVNTYDSQRTKYTRYDWNISVNATFINARFQVLGNNLGTLDPKLNMRYAIISEIEMLAAIAGFEQWFSTIDALQTDTGKFLAPTLAQNGITQFSQVIGNAINAANIANANLAGDVRKWATGNIGKMLDARRSTTLWSEIKMLYKWIADYAQNLGVRFQVALPFTCAHLDSESAQVVTSENPCDGGWTEKPYVLQLQNSFNNPVMTFLRKDDNRVGAMIAFNDYWYMDSRQNPIYNLRDVSALNETDYVITNGTVYVKANVEDDFVFENYYARTGPRAILSIPAPVYVIGDTTAADIHLANEVFGRAVAANNNFNDGQRNQALINFQGVLNQDGDSRIFMSPLPYNYDTNPFGVAVGIKSNVLTYGPWVNTPIQPPGGSKIEVEQGLTPWEYNGVAPMNIVGNYMANSAITAMRVADRGSISAPGYPALPLGAEIGATTYLNSGGYSLAATRQMTLGFNNGTSSATVNAGGVWSGAFGPNVTRINCQVSKEGITTEYVMSTYSQKFGRFEKANIDRMKSMAVWQRKFERWIGAIQSLSLNSQLNAGVLGGRIPMRVTKDDALGLMLPNAHSPHSLLVGGFTSTGAQTGNMQHSITNCFTLPVNELFHEVTNYATNGLMSMDGLLRPVSLSGSAGLPQQGNYADTNLGTPGGSQPNPNYVGRPMPIQAMPYVQSQQNGAEYDLPIWNQVLHPWQNPLSLTGSLFINPSTVSNRAPGSTSTAGHDIALLGRGTAFKQSGTVISQTTNTSLDGSEVIYPYDAGPSGDYYADYRGLALKGPMLLHSWGYDTEGRPVPNVGDVSGNSGVFGEFGSGEVFMADFLKQPNYWPVGPIDLRWDRRRGVWVSPPDYSLLVATVTGEICNIGTYNVQVNKNYIIPHNLPDKQKNPLIADTLSIPAINIYNTCYHSGDQVMVWFCAYEKQYYFLAPESNIVSGFGGSGTGCCSCNNINCTGCVSNFSSNPTFSLTGIRTFNFSSGFKLSSGNCCTVNVDVVNQGIWITGSSGNSGNCMCTGTGSSGVGQFGMCVNNLWFSPQFNVLPYNGLSNCCADISLAPGIFGITISGTSGASGSSGCTCNSGTTGTFNPNLGVCANNLVFSNDFNLTTGTSSIGCQAYLSLANRASTFMVSGSAGNSGSGGCSCSSGTTGTFLASTGICSNSLFFSTDFNITSGVTCQTQVSLANRNNTFTVSGSTGNGITGCSCTGSASGTFTAMTGICTNNLYFSNDFNVASGANCQTQISLGSRSSTFVISGSTGNASTGCVCTGSAGSFVANTGLCVNNLYFSTDFNITSGAFCQGQIALSAKPNTFTISGWNTPVTECLCTGSAPAFNPNTGICVNVLNFSTDFMIGSGTNCQGQISLNRFAPAITISGNSTFNVATGCMCTRGTGNLLNANYQNCVNNLQFSSDFVLANNGYCDTSISLNSGIFGITVSGTSGTTGITGCLCGTGLTGTFNPNFGQCTSNLIYSTDFVVTSGGPCQTKVALNRSSFAILVSGTSGITGTSGCSCSGGTGAFNPNYGVCASNLVFSNDFNLASGTGTGCQAMISLASRGSITVSGITGVYGTGCVCSGGATGVPNTGMCASFMNFGSDFLVSSGGPCQINVTLANKSAMTVSGNSGVTNLCSCTQDPFTLNTGICASTLSFNNDFVVSNLGSCGAAVALNKSGVAFVVSGFSDGTLYSPGSCACTVPGTQASASGTCASTLQFGQGFQVQSQANCGVKVSLLQQPNAITITGFGNQSTASCCTPGTPSSPQSICANNLGFGSGFIVSANGTCGALVTLGSTSNTINVSGAGTSACGQGSATTGCIKSLNFGAGLTVGVVAGCATTINAIGPVVSGYSNGGCGNTSGPVSSNVTQINFDGSFKTTIAGCTATISSPGITITGWTSSCQCGAATPAGGCCNTITFDKTFSLNGCTVSACNQGIGVSANAQICGNGYAPSCAVTGIQLGCGLNSFNAGSNLLGIANDFKVNNANTNGITFDSCFTIGGGGCCSNTTVTLNTTAGASNMFTYVNGIVANGCGISYTTSTANFTSCGLYINSTAPGGGSITFSNCACTGCSGCSGCQS